MRIEINDQHLTFIVIFFIALALVGMAGAYNSPPTGGSPQTMGHSVDEIDWAQTMTNPVAEFSAGKICVSGDCRQSWRRCVTVSSNAGESCSTCDHTINLVVDGRNICSGAGGCSVIAWSVYDGGTDSGKPRDLLMGHYIENSNGNWVYDDDEELQVVGTNGDGTAKQIFAAITGAYCRLYDDKGLLLNDRNTFFLTDESPNTICHISICARE